ncbi:uncharacterized protein LOC126852886 [Cataglyphis hispanica]|uniref:uncharacterized protein LOC126852886 n=1 Tax=Cataglyphis hispanica TaxID=1086592 RepID=UPI0021800E45|nr:uncharacterized protein LOC126852886 [Cataglyphis hispanica]
MDGRRICGTVVVKPIICKGCNVASHPSCVSRTDHPHTNGQFVNCKDTEVNSTLLNAIKKTMRSEFDIFRSEIREMYRADMLKIAEDIQNLSKRIDHLENQLVDLQPASSLSFEEDIIEEMEDRKKRATNLIFFNLDESQGNDCTDVNLVKDIIGVIQPNNTLGVKTMRLGTKSQGRSRPLRVSLPSEQDAREILRNKSRYSGPVKIAQDQTLKQRKHLKNLQSELKLLKDAGEVNKTIRYKNGVPKIVNSNRNIISKNGISSL